MKVKEIMTHDVLTVTKELSIRRLIKLLDKNKITGAPVVDEQGNLIGIVSSKDVIRAIDHLIRVHVSIDEQQDHRGRYNWVEGVMTTNVITVNEEDDVLGRVIVHTGSGPTDLQGDRRLRHVARSRAFKVDFPGE